MQASNSNLYRFLLIGTILIGAAILFWDLGSIPLLTFNEARRAIPAANMIADGDWLLPKLNGDLYITKPPLLYWLSAMISLAAGLANEWTARLPSALSGAAIAWMVYAYARRHFGPWAALFSLQILIANAGFATLGRQAGIEMLLTLFCFGALLCALKFSHEGGGRKWLFLSYFLLGAAVLTKGPIALLFVTLPLLIDALYQRNSRHWQVFKDPWAWLIFLFVGSSWYLAVTWQMGPDIWKSIVQKDMVTKINGTKGEPIYNYVLWLATDFFPVFFLVLIAPMATWREWRQRQVVVSLTVALLVPLIIYTAFSDKHAKYLLPVYPIFAILLGYRLSEIFSASSHRLKQVILALSILLPLAYALFFAFAEAKVFHYRYQALPQIRQWANAVKAVPMCAYRHADERLIYYANRTIPVIDDTKLDALTHADAILLVENSDIEKIRPQATCSLQEFKPYLRKKGVLVAFGFGTVCEKAH